MDWDKLKVFHAAAEAGSFTHAGEQLGLSQSAVSRQVSALEQELAVALFHRHARGLILTEQGELLYRTAHEVFMKLESARAKLTDSRERPHGDLKVTTTVGIGVHWLTPRLGEFVDLYPEIRIALITTDEELDLAMREADVAIRLRQPTQPDLIQRKLFSVRFHAYASPEYIKRFGTPRALDDLDNHRILLLGGSTVPQYLENRRWLIEVARNGKGPRTPALTINNVLGVLRACQRGIGVALLPDYLVEENGGLVQLFGESDTTIALDAYFVYPEELKTVARDRLELFRIDEIGIERDRRVGLAEQLHQSAVLLDQIIRQQGDADPALARAQNPEHIVDGERRGARAFAVARDLDQPAPVLEILRHRAAPQQQDAVVIEVIERARGAEPLDVFRRGIGVEAHREQLALDQVGLRRLA